MRYREHQNPRPSHLRIGGVTVQVVDSSNGDVTLGPSLLPFLARTEAPDIDLRMEWVSELLQAQGAVTFDSGTTWRVHQHEDGLRFDFGDPISAEQPYKRLIIDHGFREGVLAMSEKYFAAIQGHPDPFGYPLDELLIMHRLTQERATELHGVGIVGPDGASNLFVGHSGAGKSTTARLWTSLHKVKILSDDRIIVRERPARELQPGDDPRQIFMYGTPWHGEGCFALPERAPLHRIFILEHGYGNELTRLTKSQAVGELFARAFVPFHRHEYVDNALSFLEQLADTVPCYRYSFEPDERAVERVLNFRD